MSGHCKKCMWVVWRDGHKPGCPCQASPDGWIGLVPSGEDAS